MLDYVDGHDLADVIITGRGGGSMEDLWAFNEEIVARAIARCDIPVISAVGHEPDVTIADFAADVRAATPSNGAEIAVCDQSELRDALGQLTVRLTRAQDRRISALTDRLNRLKASPVMRSPEGAIQQRELLLELLRQRLEHAGTRRFQQEEQRLARLAGRLDALSPLKVLARGYALASREDGTVIRAAGELTPGEPIRLRLGQGSARCTVDTIEKE